MISTAQATFLFTHSPFRAYNYMHIHWNEKEAIGTSVPMAFCVRCVREAAVISSWRLFVMEKKAAGAARWSRRQVISIFTNCNQKDDVK